MLGHAATHRPNTAKSRRLLIAKCLTLHVASLPICSSNGRSPIPAPNTGNPCQSSTRAVARATTHQGRQAVGLLHRFPARECDSFEHTLLMRGYDQIRDFGNAPNSLIIE